jgi:acyl dehydratase
MTLYQDEQAFITAKTDAAEKVAKRKSRKVWALAAVGTLFAGGGVAFAAIMLQSNETEAALAKGTAAPLVLDNAEFTKPLFPGTSTGLKFRVANSNPFPATIDKIVLNGTSTTTCNIAQLTGPAAAVGTVNGLTLTLTNPVSVPANDNVTFEYPKVVTLAPAATDSCAIVAKFKVTGSGAGSGN